MDLLPIGRVVHADAGSILPNIAAPDALASWRPILDAACDAVHEVLGARPSAILIRGSIARGTARAGSSDLDLVVVHTGAIATDERARLQSLSGVITQAFPAVTEVEFVLVPDGDLRSQRWRWMRFILAHQGLTLRGEDLVARLPPPRLDINAVAHDRPGAPWMTDWETSWSGARSDAERRAVCTWLMKRYVRTAFERIMFELNGYTRDLYPAAEAVAERCPARAGAVWDACQLAVFPSAQDDAVRRAAQGMQALLDEDCFRRRPARCAVSGIGRAS